MTEELEVVPPCRVLMREGVECDEVITKRTPRSRDYYVRNGASNGERKNKPGAGRPRIHPTKPKPHAGCGHDWSRLTAVTVERIRGLQARGLGIPQIAAELGCTRHTVYARLREGRND